MKKISAITLVLFFVSSVAFGGAIGRISMSKDKQFQDRIRYYLFAHAKTVLEAASPDADDLSLAKRIYAGQFPDQHMALVIIHNTSIGTAIDNNTAVSDSDIEWAVSDQFDEMADAYAAAGLF